MSLISLVIDYILPFLVVLTALVFVHEFGHYWVARRNGVRIEVFSIGFGPEIWGRTDKAGTRWKFSAIPLGGYVKMFGDADAASTPGAALTQLSEEERKVSFHHKRLGQRAAIVAAGPLANLAFALVVLTVLFSVAGHPFPPPVVGTVLPDSAADAAGIRVGDRIVAVDGRPVYRFAEFWSAVQAAEDRPLAIDIDRNGDAVSVTAAARPTQVTSPEGESATVNLIGISAEHGPYNPLRSMGMALSESGELTWLTLQAISQMIAGQRGAEDIGGPIRIAQLSGDVAQIGIVALVWFMAVLSINLALINLFPIPLLDGGHLLFYAIEGIRGRPLGERAQEYGFRIGFALVLTLTLFATWNDLVHLRVVAIIRDAIS